jgi:hypothetical protein
MSRVGRVRYTIDISKEADALIQTRATAKGVSKAAIIRESVRLAVAIGEYADKGYKIRGLKYSDSGVLNDTAIFVF